MEFVKVASTSDVPAGKMKMVKVGEDEVLIADVGGKYYAIDNRCTHARGSLSEGSLEGSIVTCPKHGSKFDVTSGKAVQGPKIAFFKLKAKDERTFEIKVEGPDILVKTA
jgi:3-phenylpropionate/trans-cinnamate dioxygenase ferredoxin subunit